MLSSVRKKTTKQETSLQSLAFSEQVPLSKYDNACFVILLIHMLLHFFSKSSMIFACNGCIINRMFTFKTNFYMDEMVTECFNCVDFKSQLNEYAINTPAFQNGPLFRGNACCAIMLMHMLSKFFSNQV